MTPTLPHEPVVADVVRWLERAVIGLNLCPFAKSVHVKGQVHCCVAPSAEVPGVLDALDAEITGLLRVPPEVRDTTLLIVPHGFEEFILFQQLVGDAERRLRRRKLDGILQLAHFHPEFVFAASPPDDPANCTNRAPWPILHLLREQSIDQAVAAFPDPAAIFEQNIARLRSLGQEGWSRLGVGPS
jgi:hypothetical protein